AAIADLSVGFTLGFKVDTFLLFIDSENQTPKIHKAVIRNYLILGCRQSPPDPYLPVGYDFRLP
ncbi:MAG: hypothetical protein WCP96_17110, partial [Methylococcaceae bacterium]